MGSGRGSHARQRLLLLAVVLTPLALLGISGWRSWEVAWANAQVEGARTAEAAAEYAQRLLEAQLLRIERANDVLQGLTDAEIRAREPDLHAQLRRITTRSDRTAGQPSPPGFYLFVYDRNSLPLVASTLMPVPHSRPALDRELARVLGASEASPPYHVGPLHTGRDTGRQFFSVFARRERTGNGLPNGTYDGAIAASIYIDTVNPVLQAFASTPDMAVVLFRVDGTVLARSRGTIEGTRAKASPDSPIFAALARGEERGDFRTALSTDGIEGAVAFRRVGEGWPVVAVATRRRTDIVAGWRREMLPQAALAAASSLLLLLLAGSVIRRKREIEAANELLEQRVAERTQRLAERERLLSLAQQAASAASWSWNPATNEVWWSPEMFSLLGLDHARDAGAASFEGFMDMVHPDDREALRIACEAALATGAMSVEFRVLSAQSGGRQIERWLLCRAQTFPAGEMGDLLVGIDVDITDRKRAEERFETATAAMEGFVYEWDQTTGGVVRGPGVGSVVGEELAPTSDAWMCRVHPDDQARIETELRACFAVPSRNGYALEYRVRRADGSWAWVMDRGRVVRAAGSGVVVRTLGGTVDITARRVAEERQQLLMREVDHRAKNALAVVRAALRLTRDDDVAAYRAAIEGRVDALARAQSLLAETGWSGSQLRHLLEQTLQPFVAVVAAPQAVLDGPDVELSAAATQPLTLLFHELATNATKYGALSSPEGVLHVTWSMRGDAMRLRWEETGRPIQVIEPTRKGFGSRLVDATVRGQLGGALTWQWLPAGLVVELVLPTARVLSHAGAGSPIGEFDGAAS
jgi:two-component sensor histidine kinase